MSATVVSPGRRPGSGRTLLAAYAVWMVALATGFYLLPSYGQATWAAMGLTSVAAMIVGIRRNRPRHPGPWWVLTFGVLAFVAGDGTFYLISEVLGGDPFPSAADVLYFTTYILVTAGLIMLVRSSGAARSWASLLDALTLTAGVGLLTWIYLIQPRVMSPDLGLLEKTISVAYPIGDVLLVAIAAQLLTASRRASVLLLATGGACMLAADLMYGLAQIGGGYRVGGPIDLGWIGFYAALGAAALHPSMAELTEPRTLRSGEATTRRLAMVTLASLIAPAVLLAQAVRGPVRQGTVIAIMSGLMFVLVLTRLFGVVGTHRRAIARERALREAGGALVSATDQAGVAAAVRTAVAHLMPPGAPHRVALAHGTEVVAAHGDRVAALCDLRNPDGPRPPFGGAHLIYSRDLAPVLAAALADFDVTMCCPFALADGPSADPTVGALFVAADETALSTLQRSMEVLALQAALALERIALHNEITQRNSEEYFRTLVQNAADVILILGDDNRVRYASPSASGLFGRPVMVGADLVGLVEVDEAAKAARLLDLARAGEHPDDADWTVRRADGGRVQVEVSCRDLRHDRTVNGLVVTLRDVTERRRLERELTYRAFHDSLTGLANRVLFADRIRQAVERARRTGAVVGVLLIDLDDFKVVNDTLGHPTGDDLLVAVAGRLRGALRPHDTAARLGGDEFAALIDDARDPADVERVAERIIGALSEPVPVGDGLINGAASIGVATSADAAHEEELLRQADLALYVAKGAGKGRWRRYQPALHAVVAERLELRGELERALAAEEFGLLFQPIVGLTGGDTVGFEALVRWYHPTRGVLPPLDFIDVAEESGLIVPIGERVLRQAVTVAEAWRRHGPSDEGPYLSINVSARQFRTPGFVDAVLLELDKAELPPAKLMVEITESLLLRDDEQVWADLGVLRDHGVRVGIDDFGTGYSSLSYLRHVPLDVLKIDRSFTSTVASSPQQRALVEGIVALAHTLGLEVIAEGIETPAERQLLAEIGCPYGQGHLFAPPLTAHDAGRWLRTDVAA